MKNPQYSPADLARRREHVSTIPSVVRVAGEQLSASDGRSEDRVLRDLRFYRGLTDVRMRTSRESEWGVYIAESSKVVRRALDAGHEPLSFLTSDKWAADLEDVLRSHPHAPAYVADDDVLEELTGFHLHRGALAVMRRPEPKPLEEILDGARRIAVLEDIVDHTNVGAVFRSAAALGVDAVGLDASARTIPVDERLRAADGVWAIGDVTGHGAFTHTSIYQSRIAAADILGLDAEAADYRAMPAVTFTDPEVATVGLTEARARQQMTDRKSVV